MSGNGVKMRACPHCRSNDLHVETLILNAYVVCNRCLATGPMCFDTAGAVETEEMAVRAWNGDAVVFDVFFPVSGPAPDGFIQDSML